MPIHTDYITKKRGHNYLQWIFAILASCTLLVYGMESGWISPMASLLQSSDSPAGYPLSDTHISWIASAMSISAMVGVLPYSFIADRYGRKIGIIIIATLDAVAWIIRLVDSSLPSLIIARIFGGLAAGGCFIIIPMYIKEICQENLTGVLGAFPVLIKTAGVFMMYVIGAYFDYYTVSIVVMIISVMTILLMVIAPESPAFLVKQNKIDKAIAAVALFRGVDKEDAVVLDFVDTMIKEHAYFKTLPDITLKNILKNNSWRRSIIVIIVAFVFFELNGALVIITYASIVVGSIGRDFVISPEILSLSFPVVMIISSLTLMTCIEKFGRKPLVLLAYIITSGSMFALAVMTKVQREYGNVPACLHILPVILTVAMCNGGVQPLTYIIMTDFFNFQIRAKVIGVVVSFAWLLNFTSQCTFIPMVNAFGDIVPFIVYGFVNLGGVLFTIFLLPETKGKSEVEIYQKKSKKTEVTST